MPSPGVTAASDEGCSTRTGRDDDGEECEEEEEDADERRRNSRLRLLDRFICIIVEIDGVAFISTKYSQFWRKTTGRVVTIGNKSISRCMLVHSEVGSFLGSLSRDRTMRRWLRCFWWKNERG